MKVNVWKNDILYTKLTELFNDKSCRPIKFIGSCDVRKFNHSNMNF